MIRRMSSGRWGKSTERRDGIVRQSSIIVWRNSVDDKELVGGSGCDVDDEDDVDK